MSPFDQKAARLQRIERGEEGYGDGTAGEQALRFYLDELLTEAVARAKARSDQPARPVDLLISLSGFSPLTTILAYELLRPRRLLVLFSEDNRAGIDGIADHVVGAGGLRYSDFTPRQCVPTDPHGVYRVVKEELDATHAPDGERPYVVLDITGGRKVMSAAAALAAWQLNLALCYVEGDYDPRLRRPVPGSDRLLILGNPTQLFGEQAMESALRTFVSGAFDAAYQHYDDLCDTIAEPARARFMRALSGLYRAWCDLDLTAIPRRVDTMLATLDRVRHVVSPKTEQQLGVQLAFLRRLSARDPDSLLVCFFVLGGHYREIGRHDFAALLFYRTIEGCLAGRLERRAPGFTCERPDYRLLTSDVDRLAADFADVARSLGREPGSTLPPVIGLMNAALVLAALDDPLLRAAGLFTTKALGHLNTLATARNRSVLAHGDRTVDPEQSRTLESKAHAVLRAYHRLRDGDGDDRGDVGGDVGGDVDALVENLRFVRTDR
jgi:CRISPR-associated protein (Cas_Cas02710)